MRPEKKFAEAYSILIRKKNALNYRVGVMTIEKCMSEIPPLPKKQTSFRGYLGNGDVVWECNLHVAPQPLNVATP